MSGLVVERNTAVTGLNGLRDARSSNPPLTTLDQPVNDIARQLVRMLLTEVPGRKTTEQPSLQRQMIIQTTLLARASTGGIGMRIE